MELHGIVPKSKFVPMSFVAKEAARVAGKAAELAASMAPPLSLYLELRRIARGQKAGLYPEEFVFLALLRQDAEARKLSVADPAFVRTHQKSAFVRMACNLDDKDRFRKGKRRSVSAIGLYARRAGVQREDARASFLKHDLRGAHEALGCSICECKAKAKLSRVESREDLHTL
jgi:hypothetical protein